MELHQSSTALAVSGVLCSHHSLLGDPEEEQDSLDSPLEVSRVAYSREEEDSRSHSPYLLEEVEEVDNVHSHHGTIPLDSLRTGRCKAVVCRAT